MLFKVLKEDVLLEDIASVRSKYSSIDDETFNKLIQFDPTFDSSKDKVGTYGKWILDKYKAGSVTESDFGHLRDILTRFEEEKKNLKDKDIYKFRTVIELEDYLNDDSNYKELSHRQEVRQRQKERKSVDLTKDAKKVFDGSKWEIWVPETYSASCKLGQGTSWCTASTENRYYYDLYRDKYGGDYYIIINKSNPSEKYQLHLESNQFMDKNDEPVEFFNFVSKNKELDYFFASVIGDKIKDEEGIEVDTSGHVTLEESEIEISVDAPDYDILGEAIQRYLQDEGFYERYVLRGDILTEVLFDRGTAEEEFLDKGPYEVSENDGRLKLIINTLDENSLYSLRKLGIDTSKDIYDEIMSASYRDVILSSFDSAYTHAYNVGSYYACKAAILEALEKGGVSYNEVSNSLYTKVNLNDYIEQVYRYDLLAVTGNSDMNISLMAFVIGEKCRVPVPSWGWEPLSFDENSFNSQLQIELSKIKPE